VFDCYVSPENYEKLSSKARRFCYPYLLSRKISSEYNDWYALLCSLIRGADTKNLAKLTEAWPEVVAAVCELYNAPL
jgi:hypothetical protein